MRIIKSSKDISAIFNEGRWLQTPEISFIATKNEQHDQPGRVAFIAGKKLGNAVWRNRAKRRMRAIYKELQEPFYGFDIVFMARKPINQASFKEMLSNSSKAIKKLDINYD